MSGVFVGAKERTGSYGKALTNTNVTTCYTVPSVSQGVKAVAVLIGNETGGALTAQVYWYDSSPYDGVAAFSVLVGSVTLSSNNTAGSVDLMALRLDPGDEIRVKGASGATVAVIVTEYQGPG